MEEQIEWKRFRRRPCLEYIKQMAEDLNCGSHYKLKRKAEKHRERRVAANQLDSC